MPVDSEHSALAQCLRGGRPEEVRRLVLTASGGPFRGRTREQLTEVTPAEALDHPTWDMGPVVTINSATLVNKGLEVIEAHLLFDIPFDRIEVVVHPTSVVHSMVEFTDGSTLAQASPPTMLIPIALGLAWPDRLPDTAPPVDWTRAQTWEFFPLDDEAFPAVRLARDAGERGGTAPAVYNAANEVCVEAFRSGRLAFVDIVDTWPALGQAQSGEASVSGHPVGSEPDLTVDDVLAADAWARSTAAATAEGPRPMTALTYTLGVLLFAVGVAASIGLHEMGHLIPGKLFNVKVTQFFVGFGRTVWSRRKGETEYGFKAIPLGGYCKLVGMLPPEPDQDPSKLKDTRTGMFAQLVSDARSAEWEHVDEADHDRLFYNKPWWKRVIIMGSGRGDQPGAGLHALRRRVQRVRRATRPPPRSTRSRGA